MSAISCRLPYVNRQMLRCDTHTHTHTPHTPHTPIHTQSNTTHILTPHSYTHTHTPHTHTHTHTTHTPHTHTTHTHTTHTPHTHTHTAHTHTHILFPILLKRIVCQNLGMTCDTCTRVILPVSLIQENKRSVQLITFRKLCGHSCVSVWTLLNSNKLHFITCLCLPVDTLQPNQRIFVGMRTVLSGFIRYATDWQ